ncbi:MAG TPA: class I SAM-dependent methyltransferase, partial [Verrucomicrobiae bacterium]|nr:class I SAM-dependent methyltransferase [Verrucomicrobiae bacterium]
MATLKLTRGAEARIKAGHPWIYRTQVADLTGRWKAEEAVEIVDWSRRFLGRGFYNPRPSLCCRLLTRRDEPVDAGFFHRRLRAAFEYRQEASLASEAYRLVWSEADGLPGLVVDRYGPVSVVQCLTLGMSRAAPVIADGLHRLFPEGRVHRSDDATAARLEGFEAEHDPPGEELVVTEGGCRFAVTPGAGHKTGLYLDQSENRALLAHHARGRRILDGFCYAGAFACHALARGSGQALLLDSSADALALARRN